MRIVLSKDWDVPIPPPTVGREAEGHFVGRNTEVRLLASEIRRKRNGSILVSGHRGVGKTSLVYKALAETKKQDSSVVVVLLNAAQLEAESDNRTEAESDSRRIDPVKTIENLIRRLYSATRDIDLDSACKRDIEALYRKAVAKKFELVETHRRHLELVQEIEEEEITESQINERNVRDVIFAGCWAVAMALQFVGSENWGQIGNWFVKTISLLFALPIPYACNRLRRRTQRKRRLDESKRSAAELYQFDNSLGNLEFDLERIHRRISRCGKKLVYVIDELDKLKTESVEEVLKFFKNLFTLSDALFVFIGGEELYGIGRTTQEPGAYRAKEYTYFTSRYFLARPFWPDLSRFLDEVAEESDLSESESDTFKRALCFEARNDFFDLKECIRDRITGFDRDGRPIVVLRNLGDDTQRARWHRVLTVLVEDRFMSSSHTRWQENEALLRTAFEHTHTLLSSYSGEQFPDPQDSTVKGEMLRDLNGFLYRLKAFDIVGEAEKDIRGISVSVRNYRYLGSIPAEPPADTAGQTEFETRFVAGFDRYSAYIRALNSAFRVANGDSELTENDFWSSPEQFAGKIDEWGFNITEQFSRHHTIYQSIVEQAPPHPHRREDIEQWTGKLESHAHGLLAILHMVTARMLMALCPQVELLVQQLRNNTSFFSDTASPIRVAGQRVSHSVVARKDLSRQVLLVEDHVDAMRKTDEALRENLTTHRVVCFAPGSADDEADLHIVAVDSPSTLMGSLSETLTQLTQFLSG